MMTTNRIFLSFIIPFLALCDVLYPQDSALSDILKAQMISDIESLLIDNYIFEDVAQACAQLISTRLQQGDYDSIETKDRFAQQITHDLYDVSKDKHLELMVQEAVMNNNADESVFESLNRTRQSRQKSNYGFRKVEIFDGNVGYLDFQYFSQSGMAKAKTSAAMSLLSDCDALIIDMRNNTGGSPDLVAHVCSYFFEKPTLLNTLYYRRGDMTLEFWTEPVDADAMYNVPLFILTSSETFSASEEFTYDLQARERATIIGEVTGGGANISSGFRLNNSFVIYVPRGRAINPVTEANWEGIGVQPDIQVASATALEKATELAALAAEGYRAKKEQHYQSLSQKLEQQLQRTDQKFEKGYNQRFEEKLMELLQEAQSVNMIDEASLNSLGYSYLRQGKNLLALTFFKFCVTAYPESYNAYDSLGEAYMEAGNKELAIVNYQKSLDLNPDNQNAIEMLRNLRKKD